MIMISKPAGLFPTLLFTSHKSFLIHPHANSSYRPYDNRRSAIVLLFLYSYCKTVTLIDKGTIMIHLFNSLISISLCCILGFSIPLQTTATSLHDSIYQVNDTQQQEKPLGSKTIADILLDGKTGRVISIKQLYDEASIQPLSFGTNVCLYGSQPYCFSRTTSGNWHSISQWSVGVRPAQITWMKNGKTHTSPKYSQKARIIISGSPVTVIKVTLS